MDTNKRTPKKAYIIRLEMYLMNALVRDIRLRMLTKVFSNVFKFGEDSAEVNCIRWHKVISAEESKMVTGTC